jgi:hypothetical protein
LGVGGTYYRELDDKNLAPERFSEIFKLLDNVSVRMTKAYESRRFSGMENYFDISKVRNSSVTFWTHELPSEVKKGEPDGRFCNGSYVESDGDAYWTTAAHCIKGTLEEKQYFYQEGVDTAVAYVPPTQYEALNIHDVSALPNADLGMSPEDASGRVVVSFSRDMHGNEKTNFSFAVPYGKALPRFYNTGSKDHTADGSMFFVKPPEEGKVLKYDAQHKVALMTGSGSSGSMTAVKMPDGYHALGDFTDIFYIEDTCRGLCHAVSEAASPDKFRDVIAAERWKRLGAQAHL